MQWDWTASVVATLILAVIALLAIITPIILDRLQEKSNRRKLALEEIIQWAEIALGMINKYPTIGIDQLDNLLLDLHKISVHRYRISINADIVGYGLSTDITDLGDNIQEFVEEADRHSHMMGRLQKIPKPELLAEDLTDLIKTVTTLREEM